MSSKIEIQRICQQCGKEFTARTTVTKCCSDRCAKAAYRDRLRAEKVKKSNAETKAVKEKPLEDLRGKEFLSVRDASVLLDCSAKTVHRLIDRGVLKAVNLSERMTRIKRSELNTLLEKPQPTVKADSIKYEISDCYILKEVLEKYGIAEKTLYALIERNNIPKIRKGRYAYVPKTIIDSLLS